jgi:biotin carboxylase
LRLKEDPKTIFIVGAGVMQLPALRAARAMGWRVIAADGSREAEGVPLADRFEHVDLKDHQAMAEAVRRCQADGGVDGVFTAGTDFSATVAWAAEQCGLPGIGYQTALNATDKVRMRNVFREQAVPQPAFMALCPDDDPAAALERLGFPLVVKPVDNMGARGVRRIDTVPELVSAVKTAFEFSRSGRVIVEEYVAGPEFSLDALVYRGRPVLCGLAERHISFEPYFVEMGHTMPAMLDEQVKTAITAVFFRGIRALGIDNGAAKGDIKLSARGPVVGEIAARLSGGYMSGWTYPHASGVDLTRAALRLAVGLEPGDLSPKTDWFSAERAFISLPGIVETITGLEEARATPGITDVFLRARTGAGVQFPRNNIEKCGNVISRAPSREEAVRSAQEALASIFIRLRPSQPQSDAFLFGDVPAVFQAFALSDEETQAALERLPGWTGDPALWDPAAPLVYALPSLEAEAGRDWHGLTAVRALEIVRVRTGAQFVTAPGRGFVLGKPFWRAFLRAGAQGAVYLLDTLRARAAAGQSLTAYLEGASC